MTVLTSEIEVIKCRNQNMAVLLNESLIKVCKWTKIWDKKLILSLYLGYVSNILTLSSIICVGKQSGGFKISSRYFIKMLSIQRCRPYRPIPSTNSRNRAREQTLPECIKLVFVNILLGLKVILKFTLQSYNFSGRLHTSYIYYTLMLVRLYLSKLESRICEKKREKNLVSIPI